MTIKTSETHPIQVDFLLNGLLGVCEMPGRKVRSKHDRNLEIDLKRLQHEYHCKYLITFVEEKREMIKKMKYQQNEFFETVQSNSISSYHFPIRDKWLPSNTHHKLENCIEFVVNKCNEMLNNLKTQSSQESIILHCAGGKGRAPTIASLVMYVLLATRESDLVAYKCIPQESSFSMQKVIRWIRKQRKGSLKNPLQQIFLKSKGISICNKIINKYK